MQLTTANCHNNLKTIAFCHDVVWKFTSWNNFTIMFNRDALILEPHIFKQLLQIERTFKLLRLTVDDQLYHLKSDKCKVNFVVF